MTQEDQMLPISAERQAHETTPKSVALQGGGRQLGRYDFEGGGYVQIIAGGEVDTEAALDMIQTLLELKRKELSRRQIAPTALLTKPAKENEDTGT